MSVKICKLLLTMTLLAPFGCIASMAQGHFDGPKKAQEQGDTLTTTHYNNQTAYQQDSLDTMLVPKAQKHKEKKDWNGIRGYIDHIFDETDIGNNAKKFADNVVESLREVNTHTKENFEKNKVSVKSNVNKRNTAKIYLKTNRSDLFLSLIHI